MRTKDKNARKFQPVYRGLFKYFPDALLYVAHVSYIGNAQHNDPDDLHWNRELSTDEEDAMLRHLLDRAAGENVDADGVLHMGKVAWRSLSALQKELEAIQEARREVPEEFEEVDWNAPDQGAIDEYIRKLNENYGE